MTAALLALALCLCCLAPAMAAVEPTPLPPGGRQLLAAQAVLRHAAGAATGTTVAAAGIPGGSAMRVAVLRPGQAWDVEAKVAVPAPLAAGETLLLRFWLRAVRTRNESGDVAVGACLQQASPDWHKPLHQGVSANREWREILLPFRCNRDFATSTAEVALHLGDREQELDLAGVELWSFAGLDPARLPRLRITWPGMEADAPWRAEAAARIARLRMGDLAVRVRDAAGRPRPGVAVRLLQQRHAFPFGTAVTAARILGDGPDDERYRAELQALFNAAVLENDLKWPAWIGEWGGAFTRERSLAALRWLAERRFHVRGHVLVWPSWRNLPQAMQRHRGDAAAAQAAVLARIDDACAATAGLVAEWDVLNEPFDNHDLMDLCGREAMAAWFRRARERLPATCRLFINDYGIVAAGGATDTPHQRHYHDTIAWLLAQGAPVEGIGVQSHFGGQPTPPAAALAILDRFAGFGLPIAVTEFDVDSDDESYQADYLRDYLTLCFSHPAVSGFLMWGFWEGAHWRPRAAPLRRDWTERPSLSVWRELTRRTWWTDATAVTGADGVARLRGFKGSYRIEAEGSAPAEAAIGDQPAEVELR